jgi:hypothetical protein
MQCDKIRRYIVTILIASLNNQFERSDINVIKVVRLL